MREISHIQFDAKDGTPFSSKALCQLYEEVINRKVFFYSFSGREVSLLTVYREESLKTIFSCQVVFIKIFGEVDDEIVIESLRILDRNFRLVHSTPFSNYKKYRIFQWIGNNTWTIIPDTLLETYKKL